MAKAPDLVQLIGIVVPASYISPLSGGLTESIVEAMVGWMLKSASDISVNPKSVVALIRQVVELTLVTGFQVNDLGPIAVSVTTGYQGPVSPVVEYSKVTVAPAAPE